MSGRRKEGRNDGQIAIDKGVPQGLWRERSLWRERCLRKGRKVEMMVRSL